ncbi:hypothetical protein CEK26_006250 [Fusarium fujikuroi]|nr:hypothetical protein CEK27_006256 [Fusarium fujikuroi]QGI79454.1 hypothetical protein CEK25_006183 [Fusarium fujikuroi]QGI93181.1 hypothetical protein CEK26_006250 [Fusarium fujikuroi]
MTEISEKAAAATSSSNPSRPSSSSHSGSGSTDKDAVRPHMKSSSDPDNEKLDLTKADSAVIVPPKAENIEDHYRHLPPDEAEVLRRQVVSPEVKQGVAVLYRYASRNDILIILISSICSIAGGAALLMNRRVDNCVFSAQSSGAILSVSQHITESMFLVNALIIPLP